jgi:hypothetical protein
MKRLSTLLLLAASTVLHAQNNIDEFAIPANDSRITAWATGCQVNRGWIDIADKSLGQVTTGTEQNAVGPYTNFGAVLSLGDSGVATLTFATPISDVSGPDFAVFENGFIDPTDSTNAYLEFAFVEVSSDGHNFVRFPAQYTGPSEAQFDNFTYIKGYHYENLAGRYVNGYGTPFDLALLEDSAAIDISNITHVRIVDVVGNIDPQYCSRDAFGNIINDPYPSPFPSGGFDLAAVAVLNGSANAIKTPSSNKHFQLYPNPAGNYIQLNSAHSSGTFSYEIVNILGNIKSKGEAKSAEKLDVSGLQAGSYYIIINYNNLKTVINFNKQ